MTKLVLNRLTIFSPVRFASRRTTAYRRERRSSSSESLERTLCLGSIPRFYFPGEPPEFFLWLRRFVVFQAWDWGLRTWGSSPRAMQHPHRRPCSWSGECRWREKLGCIRVPRTAIERPELRREFQGRGGAPEGPILESSSPDECGVSLRRRCASVPEPSGCWPSPHTGTLRFAGHSGRK